MAGWDCGFDNDDDVLNLNLFARKSFGFQGIPKEKESVLKKIVTHIGASCDDYPKYIFTSLEHYNSLTDVGSALYNVSYIRDCVDANRCLTIEHYKFGPKYSEKKEYREFEPCCVNFHGKNDACLICDPTFQTEIPTPKATAKRARKSTAPVLEVTTKRIKKEDTELNSSTTNKVLKSWEPWEERMIIDYLICNQLIAFAKGPSVYRKIKSEGFLKHRSADSMRVHFRTKILKKIELYDLPVLVLREFKKLKKLQYSVHHQKQQKMRRRLTSSAKET